MALINRCSPKSIKRSDRNNSCLGGRGKFNLALQFVRINELCLPTANFAHRRELIAKIEELRGENNACQRR
jgi:hypothetical protein